MREQRLLVWRSLLFVPADNERFVEQAPNQGADAIILDLEDSVLPRAKVGARRTVSEAIGYLAGAGQTVLVRVNRPWRMMITDLEAVVGAGLTGVFVPKADGPSVPAVVDELLTTLEVERDLAHGSVRMFLRVESARGLMSVGPMLAASDRTVAAGVGTGDLSSSTGFDLGGHGIVHAHLTVATAAIAAGVLPIGLAGSIAEFEDMDAFRDLAMRSRSLGSVGAACIHPRQVRVLNEVFSPTAQELEWADSIIGAFATRGDGERGAFMLHGEFVDIAVLVKAQRIKETAARTGGATW